MRQTILEASCLKCFGCTKKPRGLPDFHLVQCWKSPKEETKCESLPHTFIHTHTAYFFPFLFSGKMKSEGWEILHFRNVEEGDETGHYASMYCANLTDKQWASLI